MAGKNNRRYNLRKRMNSIKHEPKRLFDTQPLLISSWEELDGLESEQYQITVELKNCNGSVTRKPEFVKDSDEFEYHYLSTHTFYGSQYYESTAMLRRLGFNVQLKNWDGETVYCQF